MHTKLLMTLSALILGALGLAASFLPHEIVGRFGIDASGLVPILVQLLGAVYLGFALLNWMARETIIGGIYARPVAMGNFMHLTVGALALVRVLPANSGSPLLWLVSAIYIIFAIWFALVLFGSPTSTPPGA